MSGTNGDLEIIANLEFSRAAERISREAHGKIAKVIALVPRGGQLEQAKLQILLDESEQMWRAYALIWQDLLVAQNNGYLTRENVDFITRKLVDLATAHKANLLKRPDFPQLASASEQVNNLIHAVGTSIRRDLEIRLRRQETFPQRPVASDKPQLGGKWSTYYCACCKRFGAECYRTWKEEIATSLLCAAVTYGITVFGDRRAWKDFETALLSFGTCWRCLRWDISSVLLGLFTEIFLQHSKLGNLAFSVLL